MYFGSSCAEPLVPILNNLESMFARVAVTIRDEDDVVAPFQCIDGCGAYAGKSDQACDHQCSDTPRAQFVLQRGMLEGAGMMLWNDTVLGEKMEPRVQSPIV